MSEKETLIPGLRVLRKLEEAGFIRLHPDTGHRVGHWTGRSVTAYYVKDAGPSLPDYPWVSRFEHGGRKYRLECFDGCRYPFVVRADTDMPMPSFV